MSPELLELLTAGGPLGVLVAVVVLLLRGDLVPRATYERETRRADRLEEMVIEAAQLTRDAAAETRETVKQLSGRRSVS